MTTLQGSEVGQLNATRTRRGNILTWSGELTVGGSGSKVCKEVGLFQADGDGGRMLARFYRSSSSLSRTVLTFV